MVETMLDYLRIALYALLFLLGFFLFQTWEKEHAELTKAPTQSEIVKPSSGKFIPLAPVTTHTTSETKPMVESASTAPSPLVAKGQIVTANTNVLSIDIDTHGGDIIKASLLKYPESLGSKQPIVLLNNDPKTAYVAESGLLSKQGPDTQEGQATYTSELSNYTLEPNQNELTVSLRWQNKDGIKVTKTFTLERDSYDIKMKYDIDNQSSQPWQGNLYTQLLRTNNPPPNNSGVISLATFFGAAVSTPKTPFTKISFSDMEKSNLNLTAKDGWAAMIQHYFISAWVPPETGTSNYYTRVTNGLYTIGMIGQPITVAGGSKAQTQSNLYIGPAIASLLDKTAPNLKLTIDYGWFWMISGIIFWMMQKIYNVVGNWGWSIVIVTIIIKLLFYKLSAKSFRSMAAMKKLQPKIEILKERYGDDKQKLTQATLELYKQEKVNPMSGCLPILIQIPVFIALYWVLIESVQLRQAPFILWVHDLSQKDPYYVLPLLMGLSLFLQQRLNPPSPDPIQAKIMMLMPVVFTILFANFPAGLMLYWFVNNTLSFLQQWFVMHRLETKKGT